MLDGPVNKSNAFDMQIAEPLFEFCHSLLTPVAINISQWNCCLGNMANVHLLMGDTECEDFFRMNMDKDWSWFHQKLVGKNNRRFCKSANIFHIMQTVLIQLFGYSIFSFRILTFNELTVSLKECKPPMLLVLRHIHIETQKHNIGVFLSAE